MSFFTINLLLAFVWAALAGMNLANLGVGFVIGFVALVLSQGFVRSGDYVRSAAAVSVLLAVFLKGLVVANLRLARDVLRREPRFRPAFLRVDSSDLYPWQVAVLAAMVSLTPGSIVVDVVDDGRALVLHTLYAREPDRARRSVRAMAEILVRIGGSRDVARGERA